MVANMEDKDFIGPRALNDYTANKANDTTDAKWEQPRKVAMCMGVSSPGMAIDTIHQQVPTESKD